MFPDISDSNAYCYDFYLIHIVTYCILFFLLCEFINGKTTVTIINGGTYMLNKYFQQTKPTTLIGILIRFNRNIVMTKIRQYKLIEQQKRPWGPLRLPLGKEHRSCHLNILMALRSDRKVLHSLKNASCLLNNFESTSNFFADREC